MPSVEPPEAAFARPPVLTQSQEDEFREIGAEGPQDAGELSSSLSRATTMQPSHSQVNNPNMESNLVEMAKEFEDQGFKIVSFEKGKG